MNYFCFQRSNLSGSLGYFDIPACHRVSHVGYHRPRRKTESPLRGQVISRGEGGFLPIYSVTQCRIFWDTFGCPSSIHCYGYVCDKYPFSSSTIYFQWSQQLVTNRTSGWDFKNHQHPWLLDGALQNESYTKVTKGTPVWSCLRWTLKALSLTALLFFATTCDKRVFPRFASNLLLGYTNEDFWFRNVSERNRCTGK